MMNEPSQPLLLYRDRLMAYLLHLVRDPAEAEDLYQEIAVVVLQTPALLTRKGDVFAYLRGIARHLASGRHRSQLRTSEALRRWTEWAWEADKEDDQSESERERQVQILRLCLEQVPGNVRRIVELRYHLGLDLKPIAESIGTTLTTVKSALFRVRRQLAQCIRKRMIQERAV